MKIAIDGPAGAGKSTIAKLLAKELNYIYVDTGAMYRAMALHMLNKNIDINNEDTVSKECVNVDIAFENTTSGQKVFLSGIDVSEEIRNEKVGLATSTSSAYGAIRSRLTDIQREIASKNDVVMDGRDIGTVVLPDAELKIYLTASVNARAQRRYKELMEKGQECDLGLICSDIEKRDHQDMTRAIAPLKKAEDAVYVDSSDLSINQVVELIKSHIPNKA